MASRFGTPVLTSDDAALVEVGGGATAVTPLDGLAEALAALVGDGATLVRLAAAGPVRAADFSWDAAARALRYACEGLLRA